MAKVQSGQFANLFLSTVVLGAALSGTAGSAHAAIAQSEPQIPTCEKKMGTLAVKEPQKQWWVQYNLDSPESLIKVIVSQSKCFTLVDRGAGLEAAQQERGLAADGDLKVGSNTGRGQMMTADYIMVPDVSSRNNDSGQSAVGGAILGSRYPVLLRVVSVLSSVTSASRARRQTWC
jgi:hypothetical protein